MCGGVGDFVENTLSSVVDVAENQIQEVLDDPVKAAAKAAAIYTGNAWALPVIEGVDTVQEGGSVEEGLISAGKAYAGQQIGAELGSQLGSGEFASTGEDFDMSGGGYYSGEDFNMGGEFATTGEDFNMGGVGGGAPIIDYSTEATLTPGGNVVPATTLPTEMAAIDAEIEAAAKALPTTISPMKALQGLRSASGLLGGGQQQQAQAYPQMQMGGRTQMPQGAVDYSGLYNLLALQRARNPNSLLG
jgi:hypothetical protein